MRTCFARLFIGVAAFALLAGGAGAARADTIFVSVESNFFDQDEITINAGDTVVWVFVSGAHTTTSVDGLWDSGIHGPGFMFEYTFNDPGDYLYVCTLHFDCCNMAGVVHVNPANPCCPPPCCPPPCCPPPCCPPPCCPPPCCPPPCCPPALLTTAVLSAVLSTVWS